MLRRSIGYGGLAVLALVLGLLGVRAVQASRHAHAVETVAALTARLAGDPRAGNGQVVDVRGEAANIDLHLLESQAYPRLPHTFVLLDATVHDPSAPQILVVYQPGQGRSAPFPFPAWANRIPFLRALAPDVPRFSYPATYKLRIQTIPIIASSCPAARCFDARLIGVAPR